MRLQMGSREAAPAALFAGSVEEEKLVEKLNGDHSQQRQAQNRAARRGYGLAAEQMAGSHGQ